MNFVCIACGHPFVNLPSQPVGQIAKTPADAVKANADAMLVEIADELALEGNYREAYETLKSRYAQEQKLDEVYGT